MTKKLFFNFYGVEVVVETLWQEIADRLDKDFSLYSCEGAKGPALSVQIDQTAISSTENAKYQYRSSKVSFYEDQGKRHCRYLDKVESEICFHTGEAKVRGLDLNSVHEVSYLLILSRVGKALDTLGMHRLHAAAFIKDEVLFLALFPSGGGKSTLISSLMEDKSFKLYSDDSPLIDSEGKVHPFAIRIGFERGSVPESLINHPYYLLKRFRYGEKALFSLRDLDWSVGGKYKEVVLLSGLRGSSASFNKNLGLSQLSHVFNEGVIGFGLPILYEYFWEYGHRDFFRKVQIVIARVLTFMKFWFKANKYEVTLTSDFNENKNLIQKLVKAVRN